MFNVKRGLVAAIVGSFLFIASGASAKGNEVHENVIYRLWRWQSDSRLPVTAKARKGYVAGFNGRVATMSEYRQQVSLALIGGNSTEGVVISCGARCQGDAMVHSFYTRETSTNEIAYAILCQCTYLSNIAISDPPVPSWYRHWLRE